MRRTRLGLGAAAGTAALALLIGGCGSSDDGNGSDGGTDGGSSSSTAGGSGDDGGGAGDGAGGKEGGGPDDGGPGGGGADNGGSGGDGGSSGGSGGSGGGDEDAAAPFQGPWASGMKGAEGELLVLIFNGTEVSLAGPDVACQGTLEAGDGPATLDLKCRDSDDEYTSGTVTAIDDEGLTVKWGSGGTAEFVKGAAPAGPPE